MALCSEPLPTARSGIVGRDDLISLKRAASKLPNRAPSKAAQDRSDVDVLTAGLADLERLAREARGRGGGGGTERR